MNKSIERFYVLRFLFQWISNACYYINTQNITELKSDQMILTQGGGFQNDSVSIFSTRKTLKGVNARK